jgi:nucleoside-diphosphate-sugar epimerase
MKIVVIGGSGLIGSKLVRKLLEHDHQAVSAALDSGVNTLTGERRRTEAHEQLRHRQPLWP